MAHEAIPASQQFDPDSLGRARYSKLEKPKDPDPLPLPPTVQHMAGLALYGSEYTGGTESVGGKNAPNPQPGFTHTLPDGTKQRYYVQAPTGVLQVPKRIKQRRLNTLAEKAHVKGAHATHLEHGEDMSKAPQSNNPLTRTAMLLVPGGRGVRKAMKYRKVADRARRKVEKHL